MTPTDLIVKKLCLSLIHILCAAVCIGAAAYAWWMENGPEKDDSDAAGKNSQGHAYTKYDSNIKAVSYTHLDVYKRQVQISDTL